MMKNKKHGGSRKGAGRKPENSEFGARAKVGYTIRTDHYTALWQKDTKPYLDLGLQISIPALAQSEGRGLGTEACLIVYHSVCEAIIRLESIRDKNEHEADEAKLHTLLNEVYYQLRSSPLFFEPGVL